MRKGSLPGAAGTPCHCPSDCHETRMSAGWGRLPFFFYGWCVSSRLYIRKAHLRYLQVEEIWEVGLYQRIRVP